MGRILRAEREGKPHRSAVTTFQWLPHSTEEECKVGSRTKSHQHVPNMYTHVCLHKSQGICAQVCDHFTAVTKGGQQKAAKAAAKSLRGRPSWPRGVNPSEAVEKIDMVTPPSWVTSGEKLTYCLSSTIARSAVACPLCSEILDCPVQLSCGKLVCAGCLSRHVHTARSCACPCCVGDAHFLTAAAIQEPPELVLNVLGSLFVHCPEKCSKIGPCTKLQQHIQSGCTKFFSEQPQHIADVLSEPVSVPPTAAQRKVATHLVRRLLTETSTGRVVELLTGGWVSCTADITRSCHCTVSTVS